MPAVSTIIAGITAASLASSAAGLFGGKKKSPPQLAPPKAPPIPTGPAPDLDAAGLAGKRPGEVGEAPAFLKMGSSMTPLQQRAHLATYGTSGNDGRYKDPAARDYYKNLALNSLINPNGSLAGPDNILPIEKQYVTNVLGQEIRGDKTENFLSALTRA